jgi:hypothetical protein
MTLAFFDSTKEGIETRGKLLRQLPWCATHRCWQCQSPPGSQAVATGACLRAPSCCRQASSRSESDWVYNNGAAGKDDAMDKEQVLNAWRRKSGGVKYMQVR